MRSVFQSFLVVLALALGASQAPALAAADEEQLEGAATFVQALANDTISVLQDKTETEAGREARFRELMETSFNVDFIGRLVLGRHWRTASPEQQTQYMDLFDDFMLNTIMSQLTAYRDESLVVTGKIPTGKRDIMVDSEVLGATQPIVVQWRVRHFDDAPLVIDVKAEGVSMVVTNREEFASIVQRRGMDGFLDTLQTKINTLKAEINAANGKSDGGASASETPSQL